MHKIINRIYLLRLIIINPSLLVKKIIFKISHYISNKKYKKEKFIFKQNYLFEKNTLDRNFGINIFSKITNEYNFLTNESSSEHQIILSAISKNKKLKHILEIGTYDGTNSFLISKLFPDAFIDTIDLPDNDKVFKNTYGRQNSEKLKKIINTRDKIIKNNHQINFIKKNSVNLINDEKKYDLIWIDGAHGYPVVTIDIINSLKLINKDGIILCDDVWIDAPPNQDKIYHSLASYETIELLAENKIINFTLFYKRLDIENNAFKHLRKYIAYIKKNK